MRMLLIDVSGAGLEWNGELDYIIANILDWATSAAFEKLAYTCPALSCRGGVGSAGCVP